MKEKTIATIIYIFLFTLFISVFIWTRIPKAIEPNILTQEQQIQNIINTIEDSDPLKPILMVVRGSLLEGTIFDLQSHVIEFASERINQLKTVVEPKVLKLENIGKES